MIPFLLTIVLVALHQVSQGKDEAIGRDPHRVFCHSPRERDTRVGRRTVSVILGGEVLVELDDSEGIVAVHRLY